MNIHKSFKNNIKKRKNIKISRKNKLSVMIRKYFGNYKILSLITGKIVDISMQLAIHGN